MQSLGGRHLNHVFGQVTVWRLCDQSTRSTCTVRPGTKDGPNTKFDHDAQSLLGRRLHVVVGDAMTSPVGPPSFAEAGPLRLRGQGGAVRFQRVVLESIAITAKIMSSLDPGSLPRPISDRRTTESISFLG